MKRYYELAEWLIASWKLANTDERIPTSHGVLDRALCELLAEAQDIPGWIKDSLTFVDTRVGLRCLELPAILDCAQESYLTSEPNYTYVTTAIKVDETTSERILEDLEIETDTARQWGLCLKRVIEKVRETDQARPDYIEAA